MKRTTVLILSLTVIFSLLLITLSVLSIRNSDEVIADLKSRFNITSDDDDNKDKDSTNNDEVDPAIKTTVGINNGEAQIKQFTDNKGYQNFIRNNQDFNRYGIGMLDDGFIMEESLLFNVENESLDSAREISQPTAFSADTTTKEGSLPINEIDGASVTNTQIMGIDEYDTLKNTRERIYYSYEDYDNFGPFQEDFFEESTGTQAEIDFISEPEPFYNNQTRTAVLDTSNPENISLLGQLKLEGGYIYESSILSIGDNYISSTDVQDTKNPNLNWEITDLNNSFYIQDSRLIDDHLLIIGEIPVYEYENQNCPIKISNEITVNCDDINYIDHEYQANSISIYMLIDAQNGEIERTFSILTNGDSQISNSLVTFDNIFIPMSISESAYSVLFSFVTETLESDLKDNAIEIDELSISNSAKYIELQSIVKQSIDENWGNNENYSNEYRQYVSNNVERFSKTGIISLNTVDLSLSNYGEVSGYINDQFSLDFFDEHLRIFTTVDNTQFNSWRGTSDNQFNKLTILNSDLDYVSEVSDLGKGESVFSARFMGDRGYVVTFREIDPFFVFDLSDPENPELKGELKIPGVSTYLHPLSEDLILGIGNQDWDFKASLFDVSDPENPIELDNYIIDGVSSEIQDNHKAFTIDRDKEIFFIPSWDEAFVMSYAQNNLSIVHKLSGYQDRWSWNEEIDRAAFIDDVFYFFSSKGVVSYNSDKWTEIQSINF